MEIEDTLTPPTEFLRGQQIAYIPNHVLDTIYGNDNFLEALQHKDVEFGFVTSSALAKDCHFCRYWLKGSNPPTLRTVSVSELTPTDNLVKYNSVDQDIVDKWLDKNDEEYTHDRLWHD